MMKTMAKTNPTYISLPPPRRIHLFYALRQFYAWYMQECPWMKEGVPIGLTFWDFRMWKSRTITTPNTWGLCCALVLYRLSVPNTQTYQIINHIPLLKQWSWKACGWIILLLKLNKIKSNQSVIFQNHWKESQTKSCWDNLTGSGILSTLEAAWYSATLY